MKILFVDDSEDDVLVVGRELRRGGINAEVRRVDTAVDLRAVLDEPWDVVLCDYSMPGFGAMEAFALVRERAADLPFIIVSGTIGEERAVEAMRAGVHDFVLKDRLARLVPAIHREIADAQRRADLRRAEAALLRNEKLRALGQMSTGIAHDLKNLLNPLGLHVEIVDRALKKAGAERPDAIGAMRDIIRRGVETIDRLRTFSRLEPEPFAERVDVAAVAREAIELARPRFGGALVLRDEVVDAGAVRGHGSEVVAAVVNLIVNAADACGEGGTVTVRTDRDDGAARIEVADDGPGMSPEVEARVFEPFFSTKGESGTGLGLANVFATMLRHGGEVRLDTAPGRGARFVLWFPR